MGINEKITEWNTFHDKRPTDLQLIVAIARHSEAMIFRYVGERLIFGHVYSSPISEWEYWIPLPEGYTDD